MREPHEWRSMTRQTRQRSERASAGVLAGVKSGET